MTFIKIQDHIQILIFPIIFLLKFTLIDDIYKGFFHFLTIVSKALCFDRNRLIMSNFLIQGRMGYFTSIFKFYWMRTMILSMFWTAFSNKMGSTGIFRKIFLFLKNTGNGLRNSFLSDDFSPRALIRLLLLKGKLYFILSAFSLYSPLHLFYNEVIPVLNLLTLLSFNQGHLFDLLFK